MDWNVKTVAGLFVSRIKQNARWKFGLHLMHEPGRKPLNSAEPDYFELCSLKSGAWCSTPALTEVCVLFSALRLLFFFFDA